MCRISQTGEMIVATEPFLFLTDIYECSFVMNRGLAYVASSCMLLHGFSCPSLNRSIHSPLPLTHFLRKGLWTLPWAAFRSSRLPIGPSPLCPPWASEIIRPLR